LPEVSPPPALSTGAVTFGSFNNLLKVSSSTIDAWAALLAAVPRSSLLLKSPTLADAGIRRHCLELFASRGIGTERIELRGAIAKPSEHLAAYAEVDVALDPFPYNGTTTTCEAMWMGVPVVTLIGDRHTGRVGFDLLTRVGLAELAAPGVDAYVAIAVALARDLPRLQRMRASLRQQMRDSALCDAPGYARKFEAALREMWRQWCKSGSG
jgi:predicted O-linked N-acetylglucosamine transferase (SPINDLY family)